MGQKPESIVDAFHKYRGENDLLAQFIKSECEIGKEFSVNASEFRTKFMELKEIGIRKNNDKEGI